MDIILAYTAQRAKGRLLVTAENANPPTTAMFEVILSDQ